MIDVQWNYERYMYKLVISTVAADGLAMKVLEHLQAQW